MNLYSTSCLCLQEAALTSEALVYKNQTNATTHWNPGFRTASSTTHTYVTGWKSETRTETVNVGLFDIEYWRNFTYERFDGFITKVDPSGTIGWTVHMKDLTGDASRGWMINDVVVLGDKIYVCGSTDARPSISASGVLLKTQEQAFVAKLTDHGSTVTCDDYTMIEGLPGGAVPTYSARANSISLQTVNDALQIVVAGDAEGNTMQVLPKKKTTPGTPTFTNLVLRSDHDHSTEDYTDAWVLRFDQDLAPTWGTTLGFNWCHDYATAVAVDTTGKIMVALKFENPDRNVHAQMNHLDDHRRVITASNQTGTFIDGGAYDNYGFTSGSWSLVLKLDPENPGNLVTSHFAPCRLDNDESGSTNRIIDMEFSNSRLYVLGDWQGRLKPFSYEQGYVPDGATFPQSTYRDLFVVRLSVSNLHHDLWRLFQSDGDERSAELTLAGQDLYLTGVAGGSLSTRKVTVAGTAAAVGIKEDFALETPARHLFWDKLSVSDFSKKWHTIPATSTGVSIPTVQELAGIGVQGNDVVLVGGWDGGSLTMGPSSGTKTHPDPSAHAGFVGFLNSDGTWKRGITVTIISEYGNPEPQLGDVSLISGGTIKARVDPEVYVDADGNVLDPTDLAAISEQAVTRYICTGYQFKSSQVNGTTNAVTFVANKSTELTFNWRTEHAIEVESAIESIDGLSSTAAGNPVPEVRKHWFTKNDPLTAFIDGAQLDSAVPGTRWRSTGFRAFGCVADAEGVSSGTNITWDAYQDRQQTEKIIASSPGRIVWQWRKELSVRVGVNSFVAEESPTISGASVTHSGAGEYWYAPNVSITASAPATIDSGQSVLALKGYTGGGGSVTPYSEKGTQSKTFSLIKPSTIIWDYANRIYEETVAIGDALTFDSITGTDASRVMSEVKPEGGNILSGPSGITWDAMWKWDAVREKLYPTAPGVFTAEFKNSAAPDDPAENIILKIVAQWPESEDYTHIVETPPVHLDRSVIDGRAFVELAYTDSRASEEGQQFSSQEDGRSVLVFADRAGGTATGNLEKESLVVKVVNSIYWRDSAADPIDVPIGSEITSAAHQVPLANLSGYVIHPLAPINGTFYDRESVQGRIFPVNEVQPVVGKVSLLSNPSFERNSFTEFPGYVGSNPAISYWATSGPTGLNPAVSSPFADNGRVPHGTNVAFIQGEGSLDSELNGLFVGGTYQGAFRVNARSGGLPSLALKIDEVDVAFSLNGADASTVASIDPVGADEPYHTVTFSFTATAASIGLEVISGPGSGDRALLVDDFQFQGPQAVFPIAWYREQDAIYWPYIAEAFAPRWPSAPNRIVIASRLGSEGLHSAGGAIQPLYEGDGFSDLAVYHQPSPNAMGYNPNEEHALLAPSFLDPKRKAAFALRRDLNRTGSAAEFTSQPYVLTQYVDRSDPDNPTPRMAVYAVTDEDAMTLDSRLPTFNQRYTYFYEIEAGLPLTAPHPYGAAFSALPMPEETRGENVDSRFSYYEDKKHNPWVVSGDTDEAEDIRATFYYPLRPDFWHPTAEPDAPMALGTVADHAYNLRYNCVWPEDSAVLKAGETLTFSGGEYASDNAQQTPRPKGLPQAAAWQSAKMVFDEANASMAAEQHVRQYLARVFPALEAHEVPLALTSVPADLQPTSGNVIVDGLLWRFKKLPASLQERVYYNTSNEKLGVRGLLNGRILGDGDLLAAPGAQTILQSNVLTFEDEALMEALSPSSDPWSNAVVALRKLSRDPKSIGLPILLGTGPSKKADEQPTLPGVGLSKEEDGTVTLASSFGPGLAVTTNPQLQQTASVGGYITIAENDHEELPDSPVAMHVIKVSPEKYRGSVAVMEPGNVFDEKVSLRHTADFGGHVCDLYFQWYLREEDGRDLNPPGIVLPDPANRDDSSWVLFKAGKGLSEIQLEGSGQRLITDNLVFCRYGYGDSPAEWSAWAGAANSREPKTETDPPYVAQLVPGWIKRVTEAVNLFDARFDDFGNQSAPATYTSAIQQAGQRWEGPVAFNPDKDAIENVGLIELYQTILDRAEDFTIATGAGSDGVNTALLNAANRIASLYTLLGNEAYADAQDPMIGYSTVGGEFGSLAPTLHAFQNQTPNLLEEELSLLRGRGEVGARPAYNRLMWNFTNGPGEAAYVLNYALQDLTNDGFLDAEDGRRQYPQGHGDAWGHYTMALKGYYDLARQSNFAWSPRSEKVTIDGIVIDVDYLDERTFAKTASARAKVGMELVDLTYRQAYTENPDGQWQGYQDTDTDRAWGVFETAQRAGNAAYLDWLFAASILPEADGANTGIRKVDRSSVPELRAIAQHGHSIQTKLNQADRGLTPAALDPNTIPFDIDPVRTDRTDIRAATHFEQVYERATVAAGNALRTFDYADALALTLRKTEATSERLREQTIDQDLAYRNQLIEIFGTPYEGVIGAGKAYPAGYRGPDLYLWMYVDRTSAHDTVLDPLDGSVVETTIVPGLRNLSADTNPFEEGAVRVGNQLVDTVSKYFPQDLELPNETPGEIALDLPRSAGSYALIAPEDWSQRRSPGAIQSSIQELVQAEWRLRSAIDSYESQADDFQNLLKRFELKSAIATENEETSEQTLEDYKKWRDVATGAFAATTLLQHLIEGTAIAAEGVVEAFPKVLGISNDATSPARAGVLFTRLGVEVGLRTLMTPFQIVEKRAELQAELAVAELDRALLTQDSKSELVDILFEINDLVNGESDALVAVIDALESTRAASDRVRTVIEQGQALIEERTVFNQRVASTTTKQRYEDYTFRVFHSEALRKYRSSFDLAARYAYLAGKAYQYELNLPDFAAANASPILADILRTRTLGEWRNGEPVLGNGGLADQLATLKDNFDTLKGQLGFNNPDTEVNAFSLRTELARIGMSSRVNADWRTQLENWRVPDLWNYQYQHNGVNYGYLFRRYCRPFASEAAGAQPALVIPFDSTIVAGQNWFGKTLQGGDSAFNTSSFSTKVRAAGVRFDGYNNTALSQTPQVYLVPVGQDRMFLPDSRSLEHRSWNVVDQRIPAPISINDSHLTSPDWQPFSGSSHGYFEEIRKFSSFRAYHDAGGWDDREMLQSGRLVGRSVWNTQWVLIIPDASLLSDAGNATAGIDTLIHGAPLPGFTQETAGLSNRDQVGIRDIRILLQTYSVSGN